MAVIRYLYRTGPVEKKNEKKDSFLCILFFLLFTLIYLFRSSYDFMTEKASFVDMNLIFLF